MNEEKINIAVNILNNQILFIVKRYFGHKLDVRVI